MGGKAVPGTDLFAVGAVLYHLLTGSKPFEGPTLQSLFYRIVTDTPRALDEIRPGLPPALNTIVQKAMQKEASNRYASALEMANAIIAVGSELSGNSYASTASLRIDSERWWNRSHRSRTRLRRANRFRGTLSAQAAGIAAALLIRMVCVRAQRRDANATPGVSHCSRHALRMSTESSADAAAALQIVASTAAEPKPTPAPRQKEVASAPVSEDGIRRRSRPTHAHSSATEARNSQGNVPRPARSRSAKPVANADRSLHSVAPADHSRTALARDHTSRAITVVRVRRPRPRQGTGSAPIARTAGGDRVALVAAYARAIESRDIGAVRRAYPGITSEQARGFEQFFRSVAQHQRHLPSRRPPDER